MAIIVNLWSRKVGEIKRFLERYYDKPLRMDEDVEQWVYIYRKPLEAVDIISVVMDNSHKFDIAVCLQVDSGDIHPVTYENHNDIIKGLFCLFYEESSEAAC